MNEYIKDILGEKANNLEVTLDAVRETWLNIRTQYMRYRSNTKNKTGMSPNKTPPIKHLDLLRNYETVSMKRRTLSNMDENDDTYEQYDDEYGERRVNEAKPPKKRGRVNDEFLSAAQKALTSLTNRLERSPAKPVANSSPKITPDSSSSHFAESIVADLNLLNGMEEVAMDRTMALMDLNDDCLLTILENVPVSDMWAVNDTCKRLRQLAMKVMRTHFRNRWFITDQSSVEFDVKTLSRFFEVFKYMNILHAYLLQDKIREFFEILKSNPPNLEKLKIFHENDVAGVIRQFPNLISLDIDTERIPNNEDLINAIQSCTNLIELTLCFSFSFNEHFYKKFFQSLELKNLKRLDLEYLSVYESVFEDLKYFLRMNPNVECLSLEFKENRRFFGIIHFDDELIVSNLGDLKELQTLAITLDNINAKKLITKMGKWNNLRCLDLCVRDPCDIGLARAFSNINNLEELRLEIRSLDPNEHFFATLCASLNNLNTLTLNHEEMDKKDLIDIITNSEKLMNLTLCTGYFRDVLTETTISSLVKCQNRKNGVRPLNISWPIRSSGISLQMIFDMFCEHDGSKSMPRYWISIGIGVGLLEELLNGMEEVAMDSPMELMDLNDDCLLTILENVPVSDMWAVSDTCQTLRQLAMRAMRTHFRNQWFVIEEHSVKSDLKNLSRFFEVFKYMDIRTFFDDPIKMRKVYEIMKSIRPNLQKLKLVNQNDVAGVIRQSPNLLSLYLKDVIRVPNNEDLIDAIQSCTNLIELTLLDSLDFDEHFYKSFFKNLELKNLKRLDISHVPVYESVFKDLKYFLRMNPSVESLSLDLTEMFDFLRLYRFKDDLLLSNLWDLKELQALTINVDCFDAEILITKLGKWNNLRCLDLSVLNQCDIDLARAFSNINNLLELHLKITFLRPKENFFATLLNGMEEVAMDSPMELMDLNDDCLLTILENVPVSDMWAVSDTCKRLRQLAMRSLFEELKYLLRMNANVECLSLDFRDDLDFERMYRFKDELLLSNLWDVKELQTLKIILDSFDAENLITKLGKWKTLRRLDLCVLNQCDIGLARAFSNIDNLVELHLEILSLDLNEHFFVTLCASLKNLNTLALVYDCIDKKTLIDIIINSKKLMNLDLEIGDFHEVLTESTIFSLVECQNRKNGLRPLKIRWATPSSHTKADLSNGIVEHLQFCY
ncbi:hypothetical protein Bhyg_08559 [Pseudolycoriella hygida]|uniref:F-box domain-containing protein n=1 Tax=Pseudolycoriella hygida TaxID=35572 RepID=A0A9Q0N651_9DIPT|nr:hypothetical protein Bhyg_08559 [Pseudolycoriella hygida]